MDNHTNPKSLVVVSFHNTTDFDFTPDMGCKFNGSPIHGSSGFGIVSGEQMQFPYDVGILLARNLAKQALLRASTYTGKGDVTIKAIFSDEDVENKANTFIKELYTEKKPIVRTEADELLAKVEEYKKLVDQVIGSRQPIVEPTPEVEKTEDAVVEEGYLDKQAVIKLLEEKGIKHDKRKPREALLALLNEEPAE